MQSYFLYVNVNVGNITIHETNCGDCQGGWGKHRATSRPDSTSFWVGRFHTPEQCEKWAAYYHSEITATRCKHCKP